MSADTDTCENCGDDLPVGCDKYCDYCLSNFFPKGYPEDDDDREEGDKLGR